MKGFNKFLVRFICNLADYVSVRDEASLEDLKKMGVRRPPLELTADPAFLLQSQVARITLPDKKKVIGIAVKAEADDSYLKEIARAADCLAKEFDAALFLVPMYYTEDLASTKKLAGLLQAEYFSLEQVLEPEALLGLFEQFALVISVRLHALIFAAAAGVPMVGIGYDPKVAAFLGQLGLATAGSVENVQAEVIVEQGRKRLNDQALKARLKIKQKELRQKAGAALEKIFFTLFESGDK